MVFILKRNETESSGLANILAQWADYVAGFQYRIREGQFTGLETDAPFGNYPASFYPAFTERGQDVILSYSIKLSDSIDKRVFVKNQDVIAKYANSEPNIAAMVDNTTSLSLGNFANGGSAWHNLPFQGIIKSFAWINQYLDADQLKDLHSSMGFNQNPNTSTEDQITQFPSSITIDGVETELDYGLILDPQYDGDLTDYSPNNISGIALAREHPGQVFPIFKKINNQWCIDFTDAAQSGLRVPNGDYGLGEEFTIIMEMKNRNIGSTQTLFSKWWDNDGTHANSSFLATFFNSQEDLLIALADTAVTTGFLCPTLDNIRDTTNFYALGISVDCNNNSTPSVTAVKNQTDRNYYLESIQNAKNTAQRGAFPGSVNF